MTKTLFKAALAATVATGLFASPALAAPNSDNADFTATARIIKPVVLSKTSDLDFGTITMGAALTSDTVDVDQAGVRTCGADLTCTGVPLAAVFTIVGVGGQTLDVDLGTPPATLDSPTDSVAFSPDAPATVLLAADGTGTFGIGGTITVLSTTDDGVYDADLNVTVTYQ